MKRVLVALFFLGFLGQSFAQQTKQLRFSEESFDFGTISESNGPVTHQFTFTNSSSRPVKILTVKASCGCTTPDWSKEPIPTGKTGFIQARFDPRGRPGFFNKTLTVTTDMEPNPIILQIKGQVSSEEIAPENAFPIVNGALRFKGSSFNMGKVFLKDEYVLREFPVYNSGESTITFSPKFVSPSYIKVDVVPKLLPAGQKGVIRVSYNGKMKNRYGFQSDNIELHTDDKINPVKSITVYATLEDYFPQMTTEELAKAPQLRLAVRELDLGNISGVVTKEVQFSNTGGQDLHVHALQPNCTCVEANAARNTIKPGDTGTIQIAFDPQGRSGTQQKAITIYSNDPRNPVQRITFSAYVN